MVGDTNDAGMAQLRGTSGHRLVPHTADLRIEAWGASREQCLVEAVLGLVGSLADVSTARPTAVQQIRLAEASDEELLVTLLDEVVYRLEVHGQVPVDVEADTTDGGLDLRLGVADLADVEIIGAAPKGISWHGLHIGPGPYGWSCAVTVDV
ncbi:archease [Streptomyces chiangmaiensis]|uniref:Archease n=1 Tax=Streptomyces chiangmaiensis TaxID=766497 RepID=A0ABU7FPM0_9ACTN|nr:archease [Streptomyces chiangmaiensis]MED7825886.1 archease [Streptomyces chiangmaiensis]